MAGAATDLPAEVMVDTGETLAMETGVTDADRTYQEMGEWNTAGDSGGWNLTSTGNLTVANGAISLTEGIVRLRLESPDSRSIPWALQW